MKVVINEVNETSICKEMNGEYILQFTDFEENFVELGFDYETLKLLYEKLKIEMNKNDR